MCVVRSILKSTLSPFLVVLPISRSFNMLHSCVTSFVLLNVETLRNNNAMNYYPETYTSFGSFRYNFCLVWSFKLHLYYFKIILESRMYIYMYTISVHIYIVKFFLRETYYLLQTVFSMTN